ncbi:chemotaxis protein [Chlorobium sp. BLA1]|uniref:chemotaxis protein n=1 Tax=Candidatus Chlorobium masyuteum TaxID=2716876 RepID=UPI0014223CD0|nr:chemotaxis protein [Candidatus Chlorobium masyuteum]NHQ61099.1 chemotaxis protein [Candidatus Chlorobium masyuteum]NTU45649.1 chemotaxis protein [Chlorobiaceae bacterium]
MLNTLRPKERNISTDKPEWVNVEYRFYPLAEAVIIGVVAFCAIFITTWFIYYHTLNAQKGEIREGLLRSGAIGALFVDGDLHSQFISRDQEQSEPYLKALEPLSNIMQADSSIAYVYTLVMKNNKVYFVLDPTPSGDRDGNGRDDKSHIMDPYPEAGPLVLRAFREQRKVVAQEPYTDSWGSFLSAYIPVYDSRHQFVCLLGIDIRADNYFERLAPIRRATIRAMVTGFFVSFLIAALVWFMRNFSKIMNHSRHRIYEDYMRLKDGEKL